MKTILVASTKGGAGKTTLTIHLAVEAAKAGKRVVISDADSQGSVSDWWNQRPTDDIAFVEFPSADKLPAMIDALDRQGYDLLIIDTPPAGGSAIAKLVDAADLMVIPVRPNPADLRAVGATIDLADAAQKPFVFVVNAIKARAKNATRTVLALAKHGRVCETMVTDLIAYAEAIGTGHAAQEAGDGKPAQEIASVWSYLDSLTTKGAKA